MTVLAVKEAKRVNHSLNTYRCDWCGFVFDKFVGTSSGSGEQKVSTQVHCPRCKNIIKTWE